MTGKLLYKVGIWRIFDTRHELFPYVYVIWAYSTIKCNHFQKFQKFKDSKVFLWPFSLALNIKFSANLTVAKRVSRRISVDKYQLNKPIIERINLIK